MATVDLAGGALAAPVRTEAELNALGQSMLTSRNSHVRATRVRVWVVRIGIIVLILGGWQLAVTVGLIDPLFVSEPTAVAAYLGGVWNQPDFWSDVSSTFIAALLALAIGSILGIAVGVVLHQIPLLRRATAPIIALLNGLPRPALAPLMIVWFGLGIFSKVSVSVTIVFFVLLVNVLAGLASVEDDHIHLARSLGMSRWQQLWLVELRSAVPSMIAGLRLGAVYAVLGVVVTEMVASTSGLGLRLVKETNSFNIGGTFAVLLVLAVMAALLDWGVSLFERRINRSLTERQD